MPETKDKNKTETHFRPTSTTLAACDVEPDAHVVEKRVVDLAKGRLPMKDEISLFASSEEGTTNKHNVRGFHTSAIFGTNLDGRGIGNAQLAPVAQHVIVDPHFQRSQQRGLAMIS